MAKMDQELIYFLYQVYFLFLYLMLLPHVLYHLLLKCHFLDILLPPGLLQTIPRKVNFASQPCQLPDLLWMAGLNPFLSNGWSVYRHLFAPYVLLVLRPRAARVNWAMMAAMMTCRNSEKYYRYWFVYCFWF